MQNRSFPPPADVAVANATASAPEREGVIMRHVSFATTLLSTVACGSVAFAQSPLDFSQPLVGKQAGTFMIRARAIGVIPEDNRSSTTIGGSVSTSATAAP